MKKVIPFAIIASMFSIPLFSDGYPVFYNDLKDNYDKYSDHRINDTEFEKIIRQICMREKKFAEKYKLAIKQLDCAAHDIAALFEQVAETARQIKNADIKGLDAAADDLNLTGRTEINKEFLEKCETMKYKGRIDNGVAYCHTTREYSDINTRTLAGENACRIILFKELYNKYSEKLPVFDFNAEFDAGDYLICRLNLGNLE